MGKHIIGRASELPPGTRRIFEAEGRSIGVFNVNGSYYALRNSCPHQAAPLCRGTVTGKQAAEAFERIDEVDLQGFSGRRDTGEDAGREHENGDPGKHAPIGCKREIGRS